MRTLVRGAACCLLLFGIVGCASSTALQQGGILVKAPNSCVVLVNDQVRGQVRATQGVMVLFAGETSLELTAFLPGSMPAKVKLFPPYPSAVQLQPEPGPEYLTGLLLRKGIRFVQRGPDLLALEPANCPVKLGSSFHIFVPRRQTDVVLVVTEITMAYVLLRSEEGEHLAFPIEKTSG